LAKIHVLLKKEELDRERLTEKTVIVLDVLFATSTIVAVLGHGASEVIPTVDGATARRIAATHRAGSYVLAGEFDAQTLPGFAHPTPLALLGENVRGRTVIYSTTNGTVALHKAAPAAHVYAAALLNAGAVVAHVNAAHPDETVLIVCAGSADNFNLEDFYAAGHLVSLFERHHPGHEFSDAAIAARLLAGRHGGRDCLRAARVGRMMQGRGLTDEVDYAAQNDVFDVVPKFEEGRLRPVKPAVAPVSGAVSSPR
jgi:2-phosphosulfolactate phosphatase